ncbi:MAG: hypothetical protein GEU81_00740 [Nitriliruptorales bacterium]|nr:hypothetical protein [Nitriliruptorales bacterium]
MLDAAELGVYIDRRLTSSAFRLEQLDWYDVESDGGDFERFMAGEEAPNPERKQPWLDRLRREAAAGILNHRVHVLTRPLSDYLRYECEWGHLPNSIAGEDIRVLDLTNRERPAGLVDHDFWLIDDEHAIRMFYDSIGRFLGAEPAPQMLHAHRQSRDIAIAAAEPFGVWWQCHPEEWHQAA